MNNTKITLSFSSFLKASVAVAALGCLFAFSSMDSKKACFIVGNAKKASFFKALGYKESGSNYSKVNKFGYLGKYQHGEEALIALGYYTKDGTTRNDWRGKWTGKYGVFSKEDFLNSPLVQEIAAQELTASNWKIAKLYKLDRFVGKKMHGVQITRAGILAAMHLKGPKSVNNFIFHGINSTDALGTGVKKYMHLFSDCEKLVAM